MVIFKSAPKTQTQDRMRQFIVPLIILVLVAIVVASEHRRPRRSDDEESDAEFLIHVAKLARKIEPFVKKGSKLHKTIKRVRNLTNRSVRVSGGQKRKDASSFDLSSIKQYFLQSMKKRMQERRKEALQNYQKKRNNQKRQKDAVESDQAMKAIRDYFQQKFANLKKLITKRTDSEQAENRNLKKVMDHARKYRGDDESESDSENSKLSHHQAHNMISAVGVSISSSGGCSDRNNKRCTSLDQVNHNTISGIVTLKTASKCPITITGGTEIGHAGGTYSHWNGYKLDIQLNSCINGYVTKSFTYIGKRGDGADQYRSSAGNIYAREGNHWDITYY